MRKQVRPASPLDTTFPVCYSLDMKKMLSEKAATVVDKETKRKLAERARKEERTEGAILRRALRWYLDLDVAEGRDV